MDEQVRAMQLLLVAYCLVNSILYYIPTANMDYDNPFTNYFYRNGSDINLCVPDTEYLRHFASSLSVDHIVWFGHNSDPVQLVSLNEIIRSTRLAPAS
tara:strand:+ start:250 stop:543 length:294 start_codon:yes stop_codon:yes gene_type:complete